MFKIKQKQVFFNNQPILLEKIFILFTFFMISCASSFNYKEKINTLLTEQRAFSAGESFMDEQKYQKAILQFNKIAQNTKNKNVRIGSYFNIASSYMRLNQCGKAEEYLNKILRRQKNKLVLGKVRLGLNDVYLCLKKDKELIQNSQMVLKDKKIMESLEVINKKLKIPSMISGAYSRINHFKEHKKFFLISQREWVEFIQNRKKTLKDEKIESMIFYYAGQSKLKEYKRQINLKNIRMILSQQMYLIYSTCLRGDSWSDQSYEDLSDNYQYLFQKIKAKKSLKKLLKTHIKNATHLAKQCSIKYKSRSLKMLILKYDRILK